MKSLRLLVLAIFAIIGASSYAQHYAFDGYIIDLQGNKIQGKIDFNTNAALAKECSFDNGNSKYHIYHPGEIMGFRFDQNGKYYVTRTFTIKGKEETVFAEYIVKGKMNLYIIDKNSEVYYLFEKENGETAVFTTYPYFAHYADWQEKQAKHEIGELRYLLKDSPSTMAEVRSIYLEKDKLIKIAKKYHEAMSSDGTECIVYESNEKAAKERIGFKVFADYHFIGTIDKHLTTVGIGAGVEFPMHRVRKGTTLELNLSLSTYSVDSEETLYRGSTMEKVVDMNYKGIGVTLNFGPKLTFGSGKVKPLTRFGVYGMLVTTHKSSQEAAEYTIEQEQPNIIQGIYVGGGIAFSVGKHKDVVVHADALPIVNPGKVAFANFALAAEFTF